MSWLSENPWPLAGTLGTIALACLIALRVTQQGKYLIRAAVAAALAAVLLLVEHVWVTDRERIEAVVYDLGRAVERADADAVLAHMTPDVTITQGGTTIGGRRAARLERAMPGMAEGATNPARLIIRGTVRTARFDFLSISRLETRAGRQTRMGQANFRVHAGGSFGSFNFLTPASGTDWSLGFREDGGRWMVESITATRTPGNFRIPTVMAEPG